MSLRAWMAGLVATAAGVVPLLAGGPSYAAAPSAPSTLLVDGQASPTVGDIPDLSWSRVGGATSYDVRVSSTSDFSSSVWSTTTSNSQWVPSAQLPAGTLYWDVRANGSGGSSGWSGAQFTRDLSAIAPTTHPVTGSGAGGTVQQPGDVPVMSWDPVAGATQYTVEVSTDPNLVDTSATHSYTTRTTSYVPTALLAPATYYWKTQAQFANGIVSAWSPTGQFTVAGLPTPAQTYPPDDQGADQPALSDVHFDWTPVSGAQSYELQVSVDHNFDSLVDPKGADPVSGYVTTYSTSYSPAWPYPNDQYYWRVRPVDASGNTIPWSQVPIRTFQRAWSAQPQPVYPADGATVTSQAMYYQWAPDEGVTDYRASRYLLQISANADMSNATTCTTTQTTLAPDTGVGGVSGCLPKVGQRTYWRVIGEDDASPGSPYGAVPTVAINAAVHSFVWNPTAVALDTPADAAQVTVPTMHWEPVAGASDYTVALASSAGTAQTTTSTRWYTPTQALKAGTTYTWSVTANMSDGSKTTSPSRTFTVDAPSASSSATSPDPLTSTTPGLRNPGLSWAAVSGADHYSLFWRPSGTTTWNQVQNLHYTATEIDQALSPGSYDWYVQPYDSSGAAMATSGTSTFGVTALPVVSGYRTALEGTALGGTAGADWCGDPANTKCANLRSTPILAWNVPDGDVSSYRLYVSNDAVYTNLVTDPAGTSYNSVTVNDPMFTFIDDLPDAQAGSAYWWEVVACTPAGCSVPPEASHSFNTLSDAVHTTNLTYVDAQGEQQTASDSAPVLADNVTLNWDDYVTTEQDTPGSATTGVTTSPDIEARYYRVQVSTDSTFQTNTQSYTTDNTAFTLSSDTYPEGRIYWRVQAIDDYGNQLSWSQTQSWVKQSTAPSPTLPGTASAPGTSTQPAVLDSAGRLAWTPIPFAGKYHLQIFKNADTKASSVNNVLDVNNVQQASYALTTPLPGGTTYAWRVQRVDATGKVGPWSGPDPSASSAGGSTAWGFFTVPQPAPTDLAPADTTVGPADVLFSWLAVPGASSYKVEREAAGGSTIVDSYTTPALGYAPPSALVGGSWQWRVTAYDDAGQPLGTTAWQPLTVSDKPVANGPVTVGETGGAAIGSALTATDPGWTPSCAAPLGQLSYQWLRDGNPIDGATASTYTLVPQDFGHDITARLTCALQGYQQGTATSGTIHPVTGPVVVASRQPTLTGKATVGQTLTTDGGDWAGSPQLSYQWLRNGKGITGATGQSYTLATADAAAKISVRVTAHVAGYADGTSTSPSRLVAKMTSTTSLALSADPVSRTTRERVTVTVSVPGVAPTGRVTVLDGSKALARATLRAARNGSLSLRLPRLARGRHHLRASFAGSAKIKPSASRPTVLVVTS